MSGDGFVDALRAELPPDGVIVDADAIAGYRRDQAIGPAAGVPRAVVRPRTTTQVRAAVRLAAAHRVPMVPRGAGSGLAGGANAIDGCLVICLDRMDRILRIDPADGIAVVEPGVLNTALRDAAAEHGLWYAPDPASRDFCTVGGNVATNAGGLCCVKYGVTRDSVLALEVVLPDGELTRLGRDSVKGVAGYDLAALFTGSEGTLGVVTAVTVRLRPLPPPALTVVGTFPGLTSAARAVRETLLRTTPSLLELLDRTTLRAVEQWRPCGLDATAAALLIAQTDLPGEAGSEEARSLEKVFAAHGASEVVRADDPDEAELMLGVRRFAYPALERLGRIYLEDVAVPRGRLVELLAGVEAIAERTGATIGTFGHAGDGNMHPLIVAPYGEPGADAAAQDAFGQIMDLAHELGGTITGEHGVGLLKRDGLVAELDPAARRLHEAIRSAIDPLGLMNPGKILHPTSPTTEGAL